MKESRTAAAALVAGLAAAAFVPSLSGAFLLDDGDYLLRNEALRSAGVWLRAFVEPGTLTANPEQAPMMYRPLTALSFALSWRLSGANPFGHHAAALLLHGLNAALVFALCLRLIGRDRTLAAGAAALLFAWHPAQVESVAYISGSRGTLLSFAFAAVAFLLYGSPRAGRRAFGPAAFAAALLCKESAAFLLLVLPAHDALRGPRQPLAERARRCAPYAGVFLAYLLVRWAVLGRLAQRGPWGGDWGTHAALAVAGLRQDLRIAFLPDALRACYSVPLSPGLGAGALLGAAGLAALCAAALYGLRRRAPAGFGAWWFLAALAPVANLVPVEALAADRFLYAPLAGLAVCAAWAFSRRERLAPLYALGLALLLLPETARLQQAWQSQFELDLAARAAAPEDPCAAANLATHYLNAGLTARARALLAEAQGPATLPGIRGAARLMTGFSHLKDGRPEAALPYLEAAALDRPEDRELGLLIRRLRAQTTGRSQTRRS